MHQVILVFKSWHNQIPIEREKCIAFDIVVRYREICGIWELPLLTFTIEVRFSSASDLFSLTVQRWLLR